MKGGSLTAYELGRGAKVILEPFEPAPCRAARGNVERYANRLVSGKASGLGESAPSGGFYTPAHDVC
jgi:hypothetical protein